MNASPSSAPAVRPPCRRHGGAGAIRLFRASLPRRPALAWAIVTFSLATVAAPAAVRDAFGATATAFPLDAVRLLDGPFRRAQELDRKFLLEIDADRLLVPFREVAGLPVTKKRYGGWESRDLNGHSLGHYLSACALMYASTGDARLKDRVDYVVNQLAEIQAAHGNGYVAGIPEKLFDDCFAGGPLRGWVPWYNVHKTFAGLVDAVQLAGNRQALAVASRFAAWAKKGTDVMSDEQFQTMLAIEYGGMNEALANLYALTGNPDHLALAQRFWQARVLDPLARGEDPLTGLHANTQIPKLVGSARLYELTGEPRYEAAARHFWDDVVRQRSFVTGSNSDHEHFFPVGEEASRLSVETAETCNVYNMLKLTRHLFAWQPDAEEMDFYERALFNHILGSIDPDTGMALYFLSLKPGHFKVYGTPDNSWWCCTGTGMENHARYGESIYFHNADTLWVNLFIASEVNWAEKGLVVRQETSFPETDTTTLVFRIEKPVTLAVRLRVPAWADRGAIVRINGEVQPIEAQPRSYLTLHREWRDGDRVEFSLPMRLRLHRAVDDPETVALLYGPIVLAGALGRENFPNDRQADHLALDFWPDPPVPVLVTEQTDLNAWIKPIPGRPLHFKTVGTGRPADVELLPLYALHHQRFTVYWKLVGPARWAAMETAFAAQETARRREEARVIDAVRFGEQQSERDHDVRGEASDAGNFGSRLFRSAKAGGWFECTLRVPPDQPVVLRANVGIRDWTDRGFDVFVEGTKIGAEPLSRNQGPQFDDLDLAIPRSLTQGRSSIVVRFHAHAGVPAGKVFSCQTLRPAPPR